MGSAPLRTVLILALALALAACQVQPQEAPSATVVDPRAREVFTAIVGWIVLGVLGFLVIIRTLLSFALEVEITGRWLWQHAGRPPIEEE